MAEGIDCAFVQDNVSLSLEPGTVRGLHLQRPPFAQAKFVTCVQGRILDVVVDVRSGSPTYGQSISVELTADGGESLYVPAGFAHGFVTFEPMSKVAYKVSARYAPDCEDGLMWDDPALGIDWRLPASGAVVSEKDLSLAPLAAFQSPFVFDGAPLSLRRV